MGAIALAVVGAGIGIAGTAMSASSADKKISKLRSARDKWLPDIDAYTNQYFEDLNQYSGEASDIADTVGMSDVDRALAMRERAAPGFSKVTSSAMDSIIPLLRGELPPGVMDAFMRSGAASSVGSGFGGSGFGAVNQGLFGARGALGAMQTGFGLLPALMSTLPNVNNPSTAMFLQSIMTPAQRTSSQLQIRGQNIAIEQTAAGMPTSGEVWGSFMQETGGAMMGAGMMGAMGGGGGGGTMSTGYGPNGNWWSPTTSSPGSLPGASRIMG